MKGKNIAHYADSETLEEINRVFKDRPDVLSKIYFAKDNEGNMPINGAIWSKIRQILLPFKQNPKQAAKMFLSQNNKGVFQMEYLSDFTLKNLLNKLTADSRIGSETVSSLIKAYKL